MSESERSAASGHEHPVKRLFLIPVTKCEETDRCNNEKKRFVGTVNAMSPAKTGEGEGDSDGDHDDIEHAVGEESESKEGQGGEDERHRHTVDGAGGGDNGANAVESVGGGPVGGGASLHICTLCLWVQLKATRLHNKPPSYGATQHPVRLSGLKQGAITI